jgi:ATP-dependent DNA helicase HFM1/MER3
MMEATQILVSDIPQFQQYFNFPAFNALQSAMMGPILESSQNLVCTAPTASGKTVVLELALLKFFHEHSVGKSKAIYIGPLKSLVTEKFEQWTAQFPHLRIGALTGDTDGDELGFLNSYDCLCATPEKLDSVTRRWKENRGLSDHIGLLLVDEIHCLSDNRGGCLEGLIARFQTMQKIRRLQGSELPISFLRIVAVSATFANVEDLADWLDAECHVFGDEFRPVPIERVVLGFPPAKNDFLFQNLLDFKLLDLIRKYSEGKPTLIFCATRKGAVETAKQLRNCAGPGFFIRDSAHRSHLFNAAMNASDKVLAETIREGIAFHSAGLAHTDRTLVETLFREGLLLAVSSTTTLGMGINLPARLVIIKGTKYYDSLKGWVSLSRTQITQLTGRAGRPQFDSAGTALILTELRDVQFFSSIVQNLDTVESHLGEHLSEFVATEIVQQTITKADEAVQWIDSTFLALRMQKNPMFYQFCNIARNSDPTDAAHQLVLQCVDDLVKKELICYTSDGGVAARIGAVLLAKFCLRVETVELIISKLKSVNSLEDVFKILCQSDEFADYGIKMGEKGALNALLKLDKLKFRICKKVSCTADKIAILLQCLLDKQNIENWQLKQEASQTLVIARRIGGAMLQFLFDASELDVHMSTLASTVQLQQSLRTVIWPDSTSPLQQLDGVGPVIAMNLSLNSISTFADVEATSAAEIGRAAQKSVTFGSNLKNSLNSIPKLSSTLDATIVGKSPHKISIRALLKQGISISSSVVVWLEILFTFCEQVQNDLTTSASLASLNLRSYAFTASIKFC